MTPTEQRLRMRAILNGSACLSPASVYDPLSARVAESVGFELGLFAGSVAASTILAAPDIVVLTLTELVEQTRRIMRCSNLSLMIDADHGYGNSLNAIRTVQELEHAGASAISIEDTVLPPTSGQSDGADDMISIEEMVGKLEASVAARKDPATVILGRTSALRGEGTEAAAARAKAYAATGVDAIFVVGVQTIDQVEAVHNASGLPIVVGQAPAALKREDLQARGARVLLQGHQPVAAAVKALLETYTHLHNGGSPTELTPRIASAQEMDKFIHGEEYRGWQRDYLK